MKAVFAAILDFLSPLKTSLVVIFAPAELTHAFAASLSASTLIGFVVTFLTTLGDDAAANPAAGIAGGLVSFALLHLAAKIGHQPASPTVLVKFASSTRSGDPAS